MINLRNIFRFNSIMIFSLLFSLITLSVHASEFKKEDNIHISKLHTIDDDFYATSNNITIDGKINGDLVYAGTDCSILGTITRSANVACQTVRHSGTIEGSLRSVSEDATLTGLINGSLLAFGKQINIKQSSVIEGDAHIFGQRIFIEGHIMRPSKLYGKNIEFTGTIDGDLEIHGEEIKILPPAIISGNLTYYSENAAVIDSNGITILGTVTHELPKKNEKESFNLFTFILNNISKLLAAFFFGIIVIRLFRPYAEESLKQLQTKTAASLSSGLISLVIFCVSVGIMIVALIAILVGKIMLSTSLAIVGSFMMIVSTLLLPITSFGSVSGGIIFYSGSIILALMVGCYLTKSFKNESDPLSARCLIIGLFIMTVVYAIPYLGTLLFFVASLIGAGAIVLGIKNCRKNNSIAKTDNDQSMPAAGTE